MISFRQATRDDAGTIRKWADDIDASRFMTNICPAGNEGTYLWEIILEEGSEIGTVWLEKTGDLKRLKLGIMMGRTDRMGVGIGAQAIRHVLEQVPEGCGEVMLNVRKNNVRAIRCYRNCGFEVTAEKEKTVDGVVIRYYEMRKMTAHG